MKDSAMDSTRSSAPQQVIDYLRENIDNGSWAIGDKIPSENALTKKLGVSRASVRLALQRFIAIGVLESAHGKGTFVVNNDVHAFANLSGSISREESRDMAKMFEFRLIVEPEACYLAVVRGDAGLIDRLRECLNAMVSSIGNSDEFIKHDMAFHAEISRAAQNPVLERSLRDVFALTHRNHARMSGIFGYRDAIYYHSVLLRAFETCDARQARTAMAEQIQSSMEQLSENPEEKAGRKETC